MQLIVLLITACCHLISETLFKTFPLNHSHSGPPISRITTKSSQGYFRRGRFCITGGGRKSFSFPRNHSKAIEALAGDCQTNIQDRSLAELAIRTPFSSSLFPKENYLSWGRQKFQQCFESHSNRSTLLDSIHFNFGINFISTCLFVLILILLLIWMLVLI